MPKQKAAKDLLEFIDRGPSPYHATAEMARRLREQDFRPLDEASAWRLSPGDKRYVIRGGASLVAFVVGNAPARDAGFLVVGAHTDSPCLRVKPNPVHARHGFVLLGCEVYGGALCSTWMDRDLSLAGRVLARSGKAAKTMLVDFARPLLRIPNLAIHLHRDVNKEGLKLNPQTQLVPVLSLSGEGDAPEVRELLAKELGDGAKARDILSYDLCLAPCEPSTFGGLSNEFVFAPRLDNLAGCHAGLTALLDASGKQPETRVLVCYDHEEIGSLSSHGAESPFLRGVLQRVGGGDAEAQSRALARSFCVSVDMAHGGHPNYSELSEPEHMPLLGKGPVLKTNANQRYATSGETAARFILASERAKVPLQHFVMRNDLACGSTIGPITAGELGIATVDVGSPMLSMHSAREMAAASDVEALISVLREFLSE